MLTTKIEKLEVIIMLGGSYLLTFSDGEDTLYLGTADRIKSLYRSIRNHSDNIIPSHCDFACFRPGRVYGLHICQNEFDPSDHDTMYPVCADAAYDIITKFGYHFIFNS